MAYQAGADSPAGSRRQSHRGTASLRSSHRPDQAHSSTTRTGITTRSWRAGLYGPLIVLDPGDRYDPATDHIAVLGLNGVLQEDQWAPGLNTINGTARPAPIVTRADAPNRLRLINITANAVTLV